MTTLKEEYQAFEEYVSDGLQIRHSGTVGTITVNTIAEYYEVDEVACEEDFSNIFSDKDVSIEDILNGNTDIDTYEHDLALESWINGNKQQMLEYVEEYEEFLDYLESSDSSYYIAIMRYIIYREL